MPFDRTRFFQALRASGVCGPRLAQTHVDGVNAILDAWEKRFLLANVDPRWIAYTLATAWHQARLDVAVREIGQGRGHAYGRPDPETGHVYYGRGLCQITWRANYARFGPLVGEDLVHNPDAALRPDISAAILVIGSVQGLFRTGHSLAVYFNAKRDDPVGARAIINGDVKKNGAVVARHHGAVLAALRTACAPDRAGRPSHLNPSETPMPSSIPTLVADVIGAAIGRVGANPAVPELKPEDARQIAREVAREVHEDPRLGEIQIAPGPKPWWASATIWGVAVSAVFKALAVLLPGKVDPALEGPVTQVVLLALSFAGDAVALFGRLRARQPIGSPA